MNRTELTPPLRQEYDAKRGYGVAKVDAPSYANIWFVVPPPPPRVLASRLPLGALAKANATLSRLPSFGEMGESDELINFFFARREAVESSRLEGTWSTIDNILSPAGVQESGAQTSGHHAVIGYARALEKQFKKALERKEKIFTEETIREIHADIVSKDPSFRGTPGTLRAPGRPGSIVQIGGSYRKEESVYNPAPPAYVKSALARVLDWLSDEVLAQRGDAGMAGFTLAVRIAIGHAHFEAVHPFTDGNGRVGRVLWPLQMICSGRMPLYLSGYVEEEKTRYSQALQAAQKRLDYGPIVEFICAAIAASESEAKATRAALEGLPQRWRARARFRANSASARALAVLLHKPILTTAVLIDELKLSKQAVAVAVKQLVERRIVRRRGKAGRTEVYAAEELLSLLSRRFGSDPEAAMEAGRQAIRAEAGP